jgi:anti-sigma regulatory factor (Ser/Thr protein kinase)
MIAARPGPERLEVTIVAVRANLAVLMGLVDQAVERGRLDQEIAAELRLAVEEVCVNVIDHGYPAGAPGPIRLAIDCEPDRVVVVVADEAAPFDPTDAPLPDLSAGIDERPIGGLGWHLVRHVIDEIEHTVPPTGGNLLKLVKYRNTTTRGKNGNRHQGSQ